MPKTAVFIHPTCPDSPQLTVVTITLTTEFSRTNYTAALNLPWDLFTTSTGVTRQLRCASQFSELICLRTINSGYAASCEKATTNTFHPTSSNTYSAVNRSERAASSFPGTPPPTEKVSWFTELPAGMGFRSKQKLNQLSHRLKILLGDYFRPSATLPFFNC